MHKKYAPFLYCAVDLCVDGWEGVDRIGKWETLEARKRLEKGAESHLSGARIVGHILYLDKYLIVIFPIVISVDTKLYTTLIFLEM